MTYLRAACFSLLLAASAQTASAQLMVIGKGDAAQCYSHAKQGNKGSYSALETCENALDQNLMAKDYAATRVNYGILQMRKENYADALENYEAALEVLPTLTEAHVNRAAALIHLERLDEALISINTALEDVESQTRPAALVNRALLYDRQENYSAAYRDLKAADQLAPDWEMVDRLLARYTVKPKS